jgi:hypothetical protein
MNKRMVRTMARERRIFLLLLFLLHRHDHHHQWPQLKVKVLHLEVYATVSRYFLLLRLIGKVDADRPSTHRSLSLTLGAQTLRILVRWIRMAAARRTR